MGTDSRPVPLSLRECKVRASLLLKELCGAEAARARQVSKVGVVALTEQLHGSLGMRGAKVGVTVLCPGWMRTRILEAERNRPGGPVQRPSPAPAQAAMVAFLQQGVDTGLTPEQVADRALSASSSSMSSPTRRCWETCARAWRPCSPQGTTDERPTPDCAAGTREKWRTDRTTNA